ncbi:cell envelope-related transcriptional attenuator [Thermovirga lienii DSM 17291]|uniref:Cell envelope-related transcriptional attenuator n=1 Tax=Thermovirga lienii (strain ATCC BAA-1197 / DSM 17291 / Cas60314) TaxID=580340 RepID=G7VA33_THELD|nr:cell envelope-related transcriptional attenuator [Thermovirga lienii DSM 17291]MDN5318874.1 polyisoprenyl-teichoic acid--peptidoglycan teichoic acid transferase [Thermovirga sp.]MDN5368465.1 polyisoprenyl-teichoic acid--peptidoglycan teichoic acid transferase [Thermovirga sp.]
MFFKKEILVISMLAIFALVAGTAFKVIPLLNPNSENIKENIVYDKKTGTVNVLIVGTDKVPGEKRNRSDTIAIASLDIDKKVIKVLTIPRDTRAQIPGKGWQKINHAYAYGGIELLGKSIVNLLAIPIHYYVVVNYDSFPKLVDLIGGVDIYVSKHLKYHDRAGNLHIDIPKGMQHLDGKTALGYVRFRNDAYGDIGRIERQKKFYNAVFEKLKQPEILTKIPSLIKEGLRLIDTNISMSQALQLASYLKDIPRENVAIATLPGRPAYIEKVSYWIPDLAAAAEFLASTPTKPKIIENDGNTKEETAKAENTIQLKWPLVILNGDGKPRLAQRFAYLMQSKGLAEISYSGNAKHFDYKYTTVRIPKDFADEDINLVVTFFTTIGLKEEMIFKNSDVKTITLILGHDYERILKKLES